MAPLSMIRIAIISAVVNLTLAQSGENYSICSWVQLRSKKSMQFIGTEKVNGPQGNIQLLSVTLYISTGAGSGGVRPGGTIAGLEVGESEDALIYSFNLGIPFNSKTSNITGLLDDESKSGGLAANNIAPNYVYGGIFSNDNEYILYGGLIRLTDSSEPPTADEVLSFEKYQYGPERESWVPGFIRSTLPDEMNRYVAAGAYTSAPSENLGFYFSGVRGKEWGPITDTDYSANTTADTLITVDMSTMREEEWNNQTLPSRIPGRTSGELVWLPVSESGILVAIGGVINAEDSFVLALNDSQIEESESTSPSFMESLPIYDIENDKWFMQNTTGDIPGQLAQFCSIVAAASDGSSYNVYIYGGYEGLSSDSRPSDDVYILSLPSFTWIKAYSGTETQGRRSHRCIKPYPDQMFVIGGQQTAINTCFQDGFIRVFNLNTLDFQDEYDPTEWSEYKVPDVVTDVIGGDADGGATKRSPSSWDEDGLSDIFSATYTNKDKIKTWYPYELTTTSDPDPSDTSSPDGGGGGGGLPLWVGPVIGVLLGLIATSAVIFGWIFWRRRRRFRRSSYGPSEGSQINNRNRVLKWMYGTKISGHKSDYTAATSELGGTEKSLPGFRGSDAGRSGVMSPTIPGSLPMRTIAEGHQEMDSKEVHEMQASGTAIELPAEPPSPKTRHPSDVSSLHDLGPSARGFSPTFSSPSPPPPETTVTDTEGNTTTADNRRPGHQQHVSFSSMNDVVSNDDDINLQRPRYISDPPSEDGLSDGGQSRS